MKVNPVEQKHQELKNLLLKQQQKEYAKSYGNIPENVIEGVLKINKLVGKENVKKLKNHDVPKLEHKTYDSKIKKPKLQNAYSSVRQKPVAKQHPKQPSTKQNSYHHWGKNYNSNDSDFGTPKMKKKPASFKKQRTTSSSVYNKGSQFDLVTLKSKPTDFMKQQFKNCYRMIANFMKSLICLIETLFVEHLLFQK